MEVNMQYLDEIMASNVDGNVHDKDTAAIAGRGNPVSKHVVSVWECLAQT